MILGSGPNRIGQGIEFDYCCVHASLALKAAGYETVMVNCNPETVSTDYDTSDRLYFEPLTAEDVMNVLVSRGERVCEVTDSVEGVIVSLGGQTPLKLAHALGDHTVLGTSPESIDLAEDRERWNDLCERLGIPQPAGGTATTVDEAVAVASKVGYPVLVRPSYVLGGRAMEIVYDDERLSEVVRELGGSFGSLEREGGVSAQRPLLVDRFLEDAVEVDVDAVRDATGEVLDCGGHGARRGGGRALGRLGVRSSSADTRLQTSSKRSTTHTRAIAEALGVDRARQRAVRRQRRGRLTCSRRIRERVARCRSSRRRPGCPMAMVAARVMLGSTLARAAVRRPADRAVRPADT